MSILMSGVWYGCMFATSTALAISDHTAVAGYIQGASRSHLRGGRGVECCHGIRRSACCGNTNMAPATAVAIKGMFLKLHSFSTLILLRFPAADSFMAAPGDICIDIVLSLFNPAYPIPDPYSWWRWLKWIELPKCVLDCDVFI